LTEEKGSKEPKQGQVSRRSALKLGVVAVVGVAVGIAATEVVQLQNISNLSSTISGQNASISSLDSSLATENTNLASLSSNLSSTQNILANQPLTVNTATKQVVIQATVNNAGFTTTSIHAISWDLGSTANVAYFTTQVSPEEVYNALVSIGAAPGNTLQVASPAGQFETGTPLNVSVTWKGLATPYKLEQLINGFTGGTPWVFGGNLSTEESAGTGCIICTFSCPVAIVSSGGIGWKSTSGNTLNSSLVPQEQAVTITFQPVS
jgi:hypothetical protein